VKNEVCLIGYRSADRSEWECVANLKNSHQMVGHISHIDSELLGVFASLVSMHDLSAAADADGKVA
jgi:hypothetical protein